MTTPSSFVSPRVHLIVTNVTALVQQVVLDTKLVAQGYDLKCASTHTHDERQV